MVTLSPNVKAPIPNPAKMGKAGGRSIASPRSPEAIETVHKTPVLKVFHVRLFFREELQWSSRSAALT